MRLLKTNSYELFEAKDIPIPFPYYAILSHTWISSKDEITYQDMKTRKGDIKNDVYKQKGWAKLRKYCDRAAKDGWEWAWMDTCCIDKSNPADTQEAINAMFRWYQSAGICYAHLEDVDVLRDIRNIDIAENADLDETVGKQNAANPSSPLHAALKRFFVKSKWFTRGWTLQELLAPHYLVFVDRSWRRIGTRENWAVEVEEASNIEACHLTGFNPTDFTSCSTAMRFSWASRRETTVEEDETYSLLGLLGISLPLIYGEGSRRAFNRLQRELITVYNDDSIFAWKEQLGISGRPLRRDHQASKSGWGILARSVKDFWDASKVKALGHYGNTFSMTNRGLEINTKHWRRKDNLNTGLIQLNCSTGTEDGAESQKTGIHLTYDADANAYHRIRIQELCDMGQVNFNEWKEELSREPILIRANHYLNRLACLSIFALEYPKEISIVAKYVATFSRSIVDNIRQLLDDDSHGTFVRDLKKDELLVEPSTVVFINIELHGEGTKWESDVIISISKNCFPRVGILGRRKEPWQRLGDPLGEGLDIYEALAGHVHFTSPSDPTYPASTVEKAESLVVGVHLLPRPPQERSRNILKEGTLREYVLKISVGPRDDDNAEGSTRQRSPEEEDGIKKRRRIS